jgi:hypothetical protein
MPLFGTLELRSATPGAPRLPHLDTDAWTLPQAEILQLAWEVRGDVMRLLPPALHPAIPQYMTFVVTRYPQTPVGPFVLAQCRLMARAGAHPRGYVLGAVTSTPEAARDLASRWGLPAEPGSIVWQRYHDQVAVSVSRDGALILGAALLDPEPISPGAVQYIHSVTLALGPEGGGKPVLVQVDPHYTLHRAERGRPKVTRFDAAAWHAEGLSLANPIAASVTTADTDLPQIRFVMDPEVPVIHGTRRLR